MKASDVTGQLGDGPEGDDHDPILECAAQWLTDRDEGWSQEKAREFECWRRADPRHEAAVAQLEHAWELLGKMPDMPDELLVRRPPEKTAPADRELVSFRSAESDKVRSALRPWWVWTGVAAAIALAAIGAWRWPDAGGNAQYFSTLLGEYERVTLEDGSMLELNAATELQVEYSATERRVRLASGEAHFTVASDPQRPFVVSADTIFVRAVGTAFNVRLAESDVEVLVTEGKVRIGQSMRVAVPGDVDEQMPLVEAGERAMLTRASTVTLPPPVIEKVTAAAIREALSWQERKLVFAELPLRDVVAEFNRRNATQLVIADAELGERLVGGVFAADNVAAFVRLLEGAGDIVAEPNGKQEIVLRRAR